MSNQASFFWCNSLMTLSFAVRLLPCKHGYENQSPKCRFLPTDNTKSGRSIKFSIPELENRESAYKDNKKCYEVYTIKPQRQFKTVQKKCKKGELIPSAIHRTQRSIQDRTNMMLKYYRKSQTLRHGWTSELSLDKNLKQQYSTKFRESLYTDSGTSALNIFCIFSPVNPFILHI